MYRILIAEDDTDINNSTAACLWQQGCVRIQAFSGTEGGCSGKRANAT